MQILSFLRFGRQIRFACASVGLALALIIVMAIAAETIRCLEKLQKVPSDNRQHNLSQVEVQFLKYYAALLESKGTQNPDLDALRLYFDLFYSWVHSVSYSSNYNDLKLSSTFNSSLAEVNAYLTFAAPLIDVPDKQLKRALPALAVGATELRSSTRKMTLDGIKHFSALAFSERTTITSTLYRLGAATLLLILFACGLIAYLVKLVRKLQQRELEAKAASAKLGAMLEGSLDAVLVTNADGSITDCNDVVEKIFGYTRAEVVSQSICDLIILESDRAGVRVGISQHISKLPENKGVQARLQAPGKDKLGREFMIEFSLETVNSASQEAWLVYYIRDISEQIDVQNQIIRARDAAQASERAKSKFIAVMSHEMRTPLNGILGSLDLLARPNLSIKQQSYIDAMRLSGDLLLNRVNDVLDLSSFESGKIALVSRAFDLSEMLEELLQSLSGAALKFGNKLVLSSTPQVPQFVLGDKTRLRQIFSNLLGNAIKYSENSQITLEVAQLTGPDSEGRIEFKVIDHGIGISEQDIPHIFEDFYTVDNSLTRKSEGTGLGLGITKRLVNKMGGEIGVTSTLGSGSVFWIRLPLPNVTAPGALDSPVPSKTASVKGERPYEILLVEDNEINRFVTTEILNTLGHNVQTADDGLKGVSEANKRAYDLILMDISMPNMDGIAATAKIRGESVYNKATPIYALTAHANHQDRERFQKEGMNECILKPISKSIIADILAEIEVSTVHS